MSLNYKRFARWSRYINDDGYEGGFDGGEVDAMLGAMEADFAEWVPLFA